MKTVKDVVDQVLRGTAPSSLSKSILASVPPATLAAVSTELDVLSLQMLLVSVGSGLKLFVGRVQKPTIDLLRHELTRGGMPRDTQVTLKVTNDADVLSATREAQRLTRPFFTPSDSIRVTTVVSELARNIYMYAKEGTVELSLAEKGNFVIFGATAHDNGPGIPNLDEIMGGQYRSKTGLGRGLHGSRGLVDTFDVQSTVGRGTTVRITKKVRRT